ncbi:MAG TPA: nucleotidyltransferase domain-containing protein [Firmicutes bacterium]|nr:nucleotidyltransferase domain-containing protein [Bacillota bacterium]
MRRHRDPSGMTPLKKKDRDALDDFVKRLRESPLREGIRDIRLFGSKLRGDDTPDSDIDVLVIVSRLDRGVKEAVIDVAFDVNLRHDVYISPRVIPEHVFRDRIWKLTPFIQTLEREGVSL